ncbi:hypothetical protein IC575_014515 [Cucumis melo]
MDQKSKIQNGNSPEPGFLQIALGGSLHATHHIQQPVTPFRNEGFDIERKPRLQHPKTLEEERRPQTHIGDEEPGQTSKDQAEEGGQGGDLTGDRITFGLKIGSLNRSS